jgi:hypothetical protein
MGGWNQSKAELRDMSDGYYPDLYFDPSPYREMKRCWDKLMDSYSITM